jgi:hypothetical protein
LGGSTLPSMMIVALHLRHRIFARRSWTFSSAIEYLAEHEGQESFTVTFYDSRRSGGGGWFSR